MSEKTPVEILEEVADALTDFVIDETVPQVFRDRVAPSVAQIDEFLADEMDGTGYYEEDEYEEEDEVVAALLDDLDDEDDESFEDDEAIAS